MVRSVINKVGRKILSNTALCYGSISLFTTVLHNVFLLYHIEMFVSVFKIDKTSFWIGETIFLLWNCFNDPLFGWIGDNTRMDRWKKKSPATPTVPKHVSSTVYQRFSEYDKQEDSTSQSPVSERKVHESLTSPSLILARIRTISICGPLLALSFVLIWFDWLIPSIQFTLCLCLYDAFLTMVDLHQSALLADLSITADERAHMNSYESIFSAVGAVSVFLSYRYWDKNDLYDFRIFCLAIAAFSACGFYIMTTALRKSYINSQNQIGLNNPQVSIEIPSVRSPLSQRQSMKGFLRQLMTHKNFLTFAVINVIQVFHCHFNSNFFPLFMEALVVDHKHYGSFLIGVSFVIPHLNNIVFLRLCRYWGLYTVIKYLFGLKLILALSMWSAGLSYGWLMCFFIACNRVCTEGTCKLLTLVITDLVDEDYVRNNRSEPISTLMFGMANFLAKPGQTLAPIIGTSLISTMTGQDLFSSTRQGARGNIPEGHAGLIYKDACFRILVYIPLTCGALQIVVWSFFKLHGTQLKRIKHIRSNLPWFLTV